PSLSTAFRRTHCRDIRANNDKPPERTQNIEERTDEVWIEPNDSWCYRNRNGVPAGHIDDHARAGGSGRASTQTTNGRRDLQKYFGSERNSYRRVHGHNGYDLGGTGPELPGLSYVGCRQKLGTVRRRHHDEKYGAADDPDGEHH